MTDKLKKTKEDLSINELVDTNQILNDNQSNMSKQLKTAHKYYDEIGLGIDFTDSLTVALGAKNIFNVFPDEYSEGRTAGFLGAIYPLNSPAGFNGGYYYLRMGWDF